jgi:DNA gyrase subunit A
MPLGLPAILLVLGLHLPRSPVASHPRLHASVRLAAPVSEGGAGDGNGGGVAVAEADDGGNIVPAVLHEEMADSYMAYAMSVIMARALPDLRDGLKPVHRRILYAMHELNLDPSGPHRKCAKVVGEVLGKYHPHGDQSVYDALVRMAQDFSLRAPLIDGHGNFGSIDPDPAAAMRYTECRLSPLAKDALLADIGFATVDYTDNFDASELEPLVLPARVPMLLLNGASGIAVGMATRIPPHNLGELIDALQAIMYDPQVSDARLLQLLPGPDFPTGGIIMGNAGAKSMYETGQGSVVMRATTVIEALPASRSRSSRQGIVVTELPYGTAKNELLIKIAAMVNAKQLIGISDIRDESSLKGVRVVFEVRACG